MIHAHCCCITHIWHLDPTRHAMLLYGGGFWVAYAQAAGVYYAAAVLLHYLVPACFPVKSIQPGSRKPGQVTREALTSIGAHSSAGALACRCEHDHPANRAAQPHPRSMKSSACVQARSR